METRPPINLQSSDLAPQLPVSSSYIVCATVPTSNQSLATGFVCQSTTDNWLRRTSPYVTDAASSGLRQRISSGNGKLFAAGKS